MKFAADTSVPVGRSRAQIEETLRRYGASEFHSGWKADAAMVMFRIRNILVRFVLPFPDRKEKRFTHKERRGYAVKLSDQQAAVAYEQEIRQRWRALLLVVKAKLEAVECGISTLEQEFLAFIILPNDQSVMEWFQAEVMQAIQAGQMPRLALPAPENRGVKPE